MSTELLFLACVTGLLAPTLAVEPKPAAAQPELLEPQQVNLPTVRLWDGDAPGAKGATDEDRPRLSIVAPDAARACGTAVIVCPGGGYNVRAMDWEGLQVARWLGGHGVSAFILCYRVRKYGYDAPDAFVDGRRAVRWLRHNADRYGIDPHRIGMIGFSAGAHLTYRVSVGYDAGAPDAADPVERESSRPDFAFLIYCPDPGAWHSQDPGRKTVDAATPPTFIFHTAEDQLLPPKGVLDYFQALRAAGVEAEVHVFGGYGPHGIGLGAGLPGPQQWPDLAANWMRRNAFLTGKERVAVEGRVSIDGKFASMIRVTFVPAESDCDPIAGVCTEQNNGKFALDAKHGPVVGRHHVEVRLLCRQFLEVPTEEDTVLYAKASPDAAGPLTVDLHPGSNVVNLDIRTQ